MWKPRRLAILGVWSVSLLVAVAPVRATELVIDQNHPLLSLVVAPEWSRFQLIHDLVSNPNKVPTQEITDLTSVAPLKHLFAASPVATAALEFILLKREGRTIEPAASPRTRPNLLVLSVPGLRGDRVSGDAAERAVAPRLQRLAREGASFDKTLAVAPWSPPSLVSLLTSLYPSFHKVETYDGKRGPRLAPAEATLAGLLKAAGYRTAALLADPRLAPRLGWERGFDTFQAVTATAASQIQSATLWLEWHEYLTQRGLNDTPTFLFLQLLELGAPFTAPEAYVRTVAGADATLPPLDAPPTHGSAAERLLYDAEVRMVDDQIGLLCDALVRLNRWGDTLLVVTAEHGYSLGERGAAATGLNLHDEYLHVPLLLSLPSKIAAEQQKSLMVSLLDVAPTLLDFAGVERPASLQGQSLRPLLSTLEASASGEIAQQLLFAELGPLEGEWTQSVRGKTVRSNRHKLIVERDAQGTRQSRGYRLATDPNEGDDVYIELAQDPDFQHLEKALRAFTRAGATYAGSMPPPTPDAALLERLRALGYGD